MLCLLLDAWGAQVVHWFFVGSAQYDQFTNLVVKKHTRGHQTFIISNIIYIP